MTYKRASQILIYVIVICIALIGLMAVLNVTQSITNKLDGVETTKADETNVDQSPTTTQGVSDVVSPEDEVFPFKLGDRDTLDYDLQVISQNSCTYILLYLELPQEYYYDVYINVPSVCASFEPYVAEYRNHEFIPGSSFQNSVAFSDQYGNYGNVKYSLFMYDVDSSYISDLTERLAKIENESGFTFEVFATGTVKG